MFHTNYAFDNGDPNADKNDFKNFPILAIANIEPTDHPIFFSVTSTKTPNNFYQYVTNPPTPHTIHIKPPLL